MIGNNNFVHTILLLLLLPYEVCCLHTFLLLQNGQNNRAGFTICELGSVEMLFVLKSAYSAVCTSTSESSSVIEIFPGSMPTSSQTITTKRARRKNGCRTKPLTNMMSALLSKKYLNVLFYSGGKTAGRETRATTPPHRDHGTFTNICTTTIPTRNNRVEIYTMYVIPRHFVHGITVYILVRVTALFIGFLEYNYLYVVTTTTSPSLPLTQTR